ncbi:MAG: phosphoribosylaminoimidazolesuccinocarboxamide synthase [Calditrichia bacterium]
MVNIVKETNIPGAHLINRGKVRDIYDAGEFLLIVTTDRISAFDVVMDEAIPYKGIVLTQISKFWFDKTGDIIENHFVSDQVSDFPAVFRDHKEVLTGRSMLVKKASPFPVECIVRGYLAGSGWKEYQKNGNIHGQKLETGLQNSSRLPTPLFTPSTKAEEGHDENITFDKMKDLIGADVSKRLKMISLAIYNQGAAIAEKHGIIIADTKFEFGLMDKEIILIDEVLTPDSSRFWPASQYAPGKNQPSLDKQYLRDYLESLSWGKTPPPPQLPPDIVQNTSKKYQEILHILTGKSVQDVAAG